MEDHCPDASRKMSLLHNRDALQSWTSLVHAVAQMVDWVHFNATREAYNHILAPRVATAIATLRGVRTDPESDEDISSELSRVLATYGWNGKQFERTVSAISLLATLKGFKVRPVRHLGRGAYARVRLALNELTGEYTVMKHVQLDTRDHGIPIHVLRELAIMKSLNHPHILRLHDVLYREEDVVLTLEYLDCNLREVIASQSTPLPLHFVKSYTHQLLQALAYAKSKRIMHRDLKPANILVNPRQGIVKIADFGLARIHNPPGERFTQQVMTLRYRAPEIMLGMRWYDTAVDMWSIGCILGEMVTSQAMFAGDSEIAQLLKIFEAMGTPTAEDWPEVCAADEYHTRFPQWPRPASIAHLVPGLDEMGVDLLTRMLEYDPRRRITAQQALDHPWFHDVILPNIY